MSLVVRIIEDFAALADVKEAWNDLWQRSETSFPTARAELIGTWLRQFAKGKRFCAVAIEHSGQFVAALPLVTTRLGKVFPVGGLPHNHWSSGGDLLIDPNCDVDESLTRIAETLGQLGWPLFRFSHVRVDTLAWQSFLTALHRVGMDVECRPSHAVKIIDIPNDWEAYRKQFSKSHRQRFNRMLKRFREQGEVRFLWAIPATLGEANQLLQDAFRIEDSGWKGRAGTSLLRAPGLADYVERLSELLIAKRELEFAFLDLNGNPVAFQILWNSKGVLHAYKGGYDERYQRFGLGHLIIHEILKELSHNGRCLAYDCVGPNTPAIDQWVGTNCQTAQVTVAPHQWLGRAMLFTYRYCRPFPISGTEMNDVEGAPRK